MALGAAVLASISGSACTVAVRAPARSLEVTLQSPMGFVLEGGEQPCRVQRARLRSVLVRADTVFFSDASVLAFPAGQPRCAVPDRGFVAITANPQLRAVHYERDSLKTLLGVVCGAAAALGVVVLLVWFAPDP